MGLIHHDTVVDVEFRNRTYHTSNIGVDFIITYARAESCIMSLKPCQHVVGVHHEPKLQSQTSKGWCRIWLIYNVCIPNSCHDSLCRSRTCHAIKGNYKVKNAHVDWELNGCDLNIMFLFRDLQKNASGCLWRCRVSHECGLCWNFEGLYNLGLHMKNKEKLRSFIVLILILSFVVSKSTLLSYQAHKQ